MSRGDPNVAHAEYLVTLPDGVTQVVKPIHITEEISNLVLEGAPVD
jgi:hypothetical protein